MQNLKRVGWHVGQPLLPSHLIAQEEALLAHFNSHLQYQGLPLFGVAQLVWDEALLIQGVVSISKLHVVFASGEVINVPENGRISTFDLNKAEKNRVTLYLHLLKESITQEESSDAFEESDRIAFFISQLSLTQERHQSGMRSSLKLAEFEKDAENRWKLSEDYSPPLLKMNDHPFLTNTSVRLETILENFQKELERESVSGQLFEQKTLETKFCLTAIVKLRRLLLNIQRNVMAHPFFLYQELSHLLDILGLIYADQSDVNLVPYQHDKLSPLFSKLIESLVQYLQPKSDPLSFLQFEQKESCYLSPKIPQELNEASEVFLILQTLDPKTKLALGGLRLSGHSRLANIHRFALTGIPLLKLGAAPFNNNFSKFAAIYKIEQDIEWNYAISEGRLGFTLDHSEEALQAFLYWR